jgi:protein phosphatase
MGEVYRGVDPTGAVVAVKLLTVVQDAPALAKRFRNEARIHATLHHPHIARMHEFIAAAPTPAIVMEYVDGDTLDHLLRRQGGLPMSRLVELAVPLIDAVGHMHARGIIHRDIKSSNVKVSAAGVIKLLDFGIAKGPGSPALTADGSVIGTLQSLAPEQLAGVPADRRSDIWSLGVLLYEMVTGTHPFATDDLVTMTARIRAGKYAPPSQRHPDLPSSIDAIISRCLRVIPTQRYHSCEALISDLKGSLDPGRPIPAFVRVGPAPSWFAPARARLPRVAAALLAASAGVLLLRMLLSSPVPPTGPQAPGLPAVSATALTAPPAAVPASGTGASPATATLREIAIHTINGAAEVWDGDRMVGTTPYRLRATIGSDVDLVLRRAGHRDHPVRFNVTEGRSEYSFVMERATGGRPHSGLPATPVLFGLAWFAWPWRRKVPVATASPPTGDRPIMHDGHGTAEQWVVVGMATDPGCQRENNEDTVRVVRPDGTDLARHGMMAVVCDGMGGHLGGETASRIAADVIAREYMAHADPGEGLRTAVIAANRAIHDAAKADQALRGMGTTCTALVLRGGMAWCAHVGDSRCYLIRDEQIFLMTEDHSAVMAMVRDRAISREEAGEHPDKNVISRALGSHAEVEVTTWPRPFVVRPGDRFLLCSDGLHDVISEESVREASLLTPPHEACRELVARTRAAGAPDNVSVIVLVVPGSIGDPTIRSTRALELVP